MLDFLRTGGLIGMLLITICAILVIILFLKKSNDIFIRKDYSKKGLVGIPFIGSMAALFGIIWQMIGMMQAFTAIQQAADISPSIIVGGLRVSMYAPLYGLITLFVSGILWYILRLKVENNRT